MDTTPTTTKNAKILLVDDSKTQLLLLREILISGGYVNLYETTDPREVVDLHREHQFDLILLDINMPHLNGFEVMELLTKIDSSERKASVITVSGDTSDETQDQAYKHGAKDFITKPFHVHKLLSQVDYHLEKQLDNATSY